ATARLGSIPTSALDGMISAANGGTGLNGGSAGNGRILIGNGSGYTLATMNVSNGITQTLSSGGISLSTNATNANTANTIVSRDGSGGFSAGSISALNLGLRGSSSGVLTMDTPASFTSYTLVWPSNSGSNGQFLTTNGSGTLSWTTPTV